MGGRLLYLAVNTLCWQVKSVHDWQPEEKNLLRQVFEHGLRVWPTLVRCIHATHGTLAIKGTECNYAWETLAQFDLELVALARAGRWDDAVNMMADRFQHEMLRHWPDCSLELYRSFITEHSARRSPAATPAAHPG